MHTCGRSSTTRRRDPHSYDASPSDAAAIADANLVVYNGGGYDQFVDAVLGQHAAVKRVNAFIVGGHQPRNNPHVFYDLDTVSAVADAIADRLATIDPRTPRNTAPTPAHTSAEVHEIADAERAIAATHPGAARDRDRGRRRIPQRPPSGLADKTPQGYYKAVNADADPAPADIAAVLDLVNSRAVQVVLSNPQTDTPVTHRIVDAATAARVPVVEVRETLPAGVDFLTWQRQTVDRLSTALQQTDNHTP